MESGRRTIKTDLTGRITAITPRLRLDEPLRNHTTFRIGGPARYYAEAHAVDELRALRALAAGEKLPFLVLGGGSNILFGDAGFPGLVVRLSGAFREARFEGERLHAGAGAIVAGLVRACAERELGGMERMAGIPGTLGGALVGNAGTSAGSLGDLVESVEVLTAAGQTAVLGREELQFGYRRSNLAGYIVLGTVLCLKKAQKNDILNTVNTLMLRRNESQPEGAWSAGSVFKNPPGASAWKLIEDAGLRGLRFGDAQVSEKHTNFIINTDHAKASDVRALITIIRQKVKECSGVELELEIKLIGS